MNKKRIILILITLVLVIASVIIGILIVKNENDNASVKEYKVIDSNLESNYVSLKSDIYYHHSVCAILHFFRYTIYPLLVALSLAFSC